MKGLVLSLFLIASHPSPMTNAAYHSSGWTLNGDLANQCVLATLGDVQDERGAQLTVQCDSESNLTGNVMLKLPAAQLQYKRVNVTANVAHDEQTSSTLWIKSSRDNRTLLFETDSEELLLSGVSQTRRSMVSVVSTDADVVSFGVMLHGKGTITLRDVRITVSDQGEIAMQAQQVLDEALAIIHQHSAINDASWGSLCDRARQFASGAKNSADVYPVIRYVLQQLGDKRSLVLTPQLSRALDQHPHSTSSSIRIYSLQDGAELVLAASALSDHTSDSRVATNWP